MFAPSLHLLSGGEADRLKLFVQNGGTLVSTFNTGLVDEHTLTNRGIPYPNRIRARISRLQSNASHGNVLPHPRSALGAYTVTLMLAGFNTLDVAKAQVGQFSQPLLGHACESALSANIRPKVLLLREKLALVWHGGLPENAGLT